VYQKPVHYIIVHTWFEVFIIYKFFIFLFLFLPELKIVEDKTGLSPYASAVYDITDPLLPVRGHGLIELTRLVEARDEETMGQLVAVVDMFKQSLEEEDTYIYLSAINGLVSCAR
jgi:hypothetical protein